MTVNMPAAKTGWSIGRVGGFCLSIVLIVGASALSYRSQQDLLDAWGAVDHTRDVLYQIQQLLSLLKDAETGQRGFLITGDDRFLEPYKAAIQAIPAATAAVRTLTADNPNQQHRLDALQALMSERQALLARHIETRRAQGLGALDPAELLRGRELMDRIRDSVDAMAAEENDLDRVRTQTVRNGARQSDYLLLLGMIISLSIISVIFYQMGHEVGRRRAAESDVRNLNLSLEQRVHARTEQLEASEQSYRRVVDLMQEAIWIHADGKVVFANPAAAKLFGARHPDELIGRPSIGWVHPDDRDRAAARTRQLTASPCTVPVTEMRLMTGDGRVRTTAIHAASFLQDGKIRVMASAVDVTELREAETQLHQAQKMESVGQLTGGLAHDFNNLLTVVIGNLDAVLERVQGDTRRAIEGALRAAERGAALVQRLLAFSRRQTLVPESINLGDMVSGIEDLLRRTLGEHIEIEMKLARDLGPALADRAQVESALLNLAVNARDAMPEGGKLTIETGNTHLDEHYAAHNAEVAPGDYIMLAVTDTGSGMPPEVVQRAFEPFFTTKGVGKGTGLGLSMIYGFAKQSGGHLKIYSEVGHGTTVRLYLPQVSATGVVVALPTAVADQHPRGGETILVVEDDPDVRGFVVGQLRDLGYRIIETADGPQAQAILESDQAVDLLLTDVVMPGGMTGRQLADSAKARRSGLKTLFISGYTENSIVHQGKLDPGVHFLAKPFRRHDLASKVREVLDTA
jgi:PAS domain S-box-containing protein